MRIIVMSDSHRSLTNVERIIRCNPEADMFIHLGDGEREIAQVQINHPKLDFRCVKGNCDTTSCAPGRLIVDANGVKIFCTHGDGQNVQYGVENLALEALKNGCTVALYGHTHERFIGRQDGVDIMNPGSCSCPRDGMKPSYGFIDILPAGVFMNIVDVGV